MDKLYFNQTGGFPLSTNILNAIQQAYSVFNALGSAAGNFAILSGCEIAGNNIADGVVYINGEVLPFRGGVGENVIITKDSEDRVFEDGATKTVLEKRYACFGSTTPNYAFADFKRITQTLPQLAAEKAEKTALEALLLKVEALEKKAAVFTAGGGMVLWNKPANLIPPGWQEVEDWRGRMPVGWDPGDPDFTWEKGFGGSKTVRLSKENLPSFSYTDSYFKSGRQDWKAGGDPDGNATGYDREQTRTLYFENKEFSIMPKYRIVMFIEYKG